MIASEYLASETLRNGKAVRIRALTSTDRSSMLEAVARIGEASLYRRFFSVKHHFSESELDYYLNVDFVRHVALVAELQEQGRAVIAGGGRYVVTGPGSAELAFAVDDPHHGLGIGTLLMRHLARIAHAAQLHTLTAEVLVDNAPMLAVFRHCGLPLELRREGGITQVRMDCRQISDTWRGDDAASHPGAN